jgi:hypothetical protein
MTLFTPTQLRFNEGDDKALRRVSESLQRVIHKEIASDFIMITEVELTRRLITAMQDQGIRFSIKEGYR